MATTHYHCHYCDCTDTLQRFTFDEQLLRCPNCGTSDKVIPMRVFRCSGCGHVSEQSSFFGTEIPADEDPMESGRVRTCHRGFCKSTTYGQVSIRETRPGDPSKSLHRAPVAKKVHHKKGNRR